MKNSRGVMIKVIGDTRESIRIIGTIRIRTGYRVSVATYRRERPGSDIDNTYGYYPP